MAGPRETSNGGDRPEPAGLAPPMQPRATNRSMPTQRDHDGWDVHRVFEALRRRIWLVLLCIVVVPLAALGLSLTQQKEYTANIALLFRNPGFSQEILGKGGLILPSSDPDREAATNLRLVSLDTVDRLVAERLGISVDEVRKKYTVQAEGNSDIVQVSATDPDPRTAANLANIFGEEYIAFRRDADRAKILQAADLVTKRLDQIQPGPGSDVRRARLESRLEQLQTLASLQTGNAEIVEPARIPSNPSSPRVVRNTVLGGLLGIVLGVTLALILDRVDRRMREPDEIQELFDLPILGYIPESGTLRKPTGGPHLRGREGEAFRMLRTSLLYFNVDKHIRSLLITSSTPGEGKTTVSWNLACAAAAGGANVLLIEADMRHPNLRRHVGTIADPGPGLSEILAGDLDPSREVTRVPIAPGAKGPGGEPVEMDIILSGPVPPNPADLLESKRMRRLIEEAEQSYDLVVIDSPPTFVVPDAVPLVKQVSAVLVVSRVGLTTRDAARQLRDQLDNLSAPTLGIVVNSVEQWRERYAYAYAYASQPTSNGAEAEKPRRRMLGRRRAGTGDSTNGKDAASSGKRPSSRDRG